MRRGEIRWYQFAEPDKRRPVLILGRQSVLGALHQVIVVPTTRTVRGLQTEVVLSEADGMPTHCALNADHLAAARLDRLGGVLAVLPEPRWPEVDMAVRVACGFAAQH
ncbi:MAG: type II toxin-antitoxin system PemK/MazF family toxin [Deltaproteobacteria bacterium]|nr:type II toxin-antitoxin system PemK/MazF family toxin [Deltaproteobacteria bacterium]